MKNHRIRETCIFMLNLKENWIVVEEFDWEKGCNGGKLWEGRELT
jgi:hypothetical protein